MEQVQTRSVIEASLALLGLWLLLWKIPGFASSVYITLTGIDEVPPRMLEYHGVHLIGHGLVGLLLITLRSKVAAWLVPVDSSTWFQPSIFVSCGTAVVGIYFFASGITSLGESFGGQQAASSSNPYLWWRGIFACATGVALFVFSAGIGRLWSLIRGLRHAGV